MASRQTGKNHITCLPRARWIVVKEQTDDITRGVEAADWVAGSIEHLGALVDLQAAEGEGNTAGDRIRNAVRSVLTTTERDLAQVDGCRRRAHSVQRPHVPRQPEECPRRPANDVGRRLERGDLRRRILP